MTTAARRARAERLLMMRVVNKTPCAEAWRAVRPNAKCTDSSAGELVRREIRWLDEVREREAQERRSQSGLTVLLFGQYNPDMLRDMLIADSEPDEPSEEPAPPQKTRRCEGVAGRQCEQKIPALRNQKRCANCAKETRKLQKRDYSRTYYQANLVRLLGKLRERRNHQPLRDWIKEERERRAAMPRVERGADNRLYLYRPTTGEREPLR